MFRNEIKEGSQPGFHVSPVLVTPDHGVVNGIFPGGAYGWKASASIVDLVVPRVNAVSQTSFFRHLVGSGRFGKSNGFGNRLE
jgi:hypothetical protein